jgi:DNA-binding beta-propeller fold protein YncE
MLGYTRLFNISDSVPTQVNTWEYYPSQGLTSAVVGLPLSNGSVAMVNTTSMKLIRTIGAGGQSGFIGVAPNQNETLLAVADGPAGIVEVINLNTLQVVFNQTYTIPSSGGKTAYPCDVNWTPQGSIVVPMKNNNTLVTINGATGAIIADANLKGPFMLSASPTSVNPSGTMVAVELLNKTDAFYSLPSLTPMGHVILNSTNFSVIKGAFTPDGKYYLEGSSSSNVIDVISLSNYQVVNTITLAASSSPGLGGVAITPDSNYVYAVQHGTPSTGGIIYLIPLANIASSNAAPTSSIALTTAPAIAIPVSTSMGNYLANDVLSPPVTGLHC